MVTYDEIIASRIIGFIEPVSNSDNARITVIGYKNTNDDYISLDKSKAKLKSKARNKQRHEW